MKNTTAIVILERIQNPCATLEMIGHKVGLTRERVRQILNSEGIRTRHFIPRPEYPCLNCGTITRHKRYCSETCQFLFNMIPLVCDECGRLFYRKKDNVIASLGHHKGQRVWCTKRCQGKWLGRTNKGKRKRRKYDWDTALELRKMGTKPKEIYQRLNIPKNTFYPSIYRYENLLTK